MSSDVATLMLLDTIVEAGDRLAILVESSSSEAINEDWRTYDAICLGLIRIGEAARALPTTVKDRQADIPWSTIVALRNRIAHGYASLQKQRVWEIASLSVPSFVAATRLLRADLEGLA